MKAQSYFDECIQKFGFCFIAEISNNNLVDFDRYLKLIDVAANQGVHAVDTDLWSSSLLSISAVRHCQRGSLEGKPIGISIAYLCSLD